MDDEFFDRVHEIRVSVKAKATATAPQAGELIN